MKKIVALGILLFSISLFIFCTQKKQQKNNPYKDSPYASLRDSVGYVGMKTCTSCHQDVHSTFMHTGMGESWGKATKEKSKGIFDVHAIVYDTTRNFYYRPFWNNDSLYITEFRLNKKDTIFKRTEKISYIVGSGQHTNSHIWRSNGYLYQAPITFYTQKGIWDLAPGFDEGFNSRWNRIISVECMNCHNMYPAHDALSADNKFISVKEGIECERCHGPGEAHVKAKMRGEIVDTSKFIDYTIVNPKKLPRDLQVELCQRCHLQGITVLNEGKTYFDFKPGMYLKDVMNVFMPRYEGNPSKFIMASHADRMKQSKCYQKSNMTCLTCHNPHVSVTVTPAQIFNNTCISCHKNSDTCTENIKVRMLQQDNCFSCHMPVSQTLDIPHVTVHDHRIHIVQPGENDIPLKFTGLECMTQKNPSPVVMAEGYLSTYESYASKSFLLDSAKYYLSLVKDSSSHSQKVKVRYYYLKNDYPSLIKAASLLPANEVEDAWTYYRMGEAYFQTGLFSSAYDYFSKAVAQLPEELDFLNQKAKTLVILNKVDEAKSIFEKILQLQPEYENALSNLGYIYMLKGDAPYASTLIDKALALNPDSEDALMNKVALLIGLKRNAEAIGMLKRVLVIDPSNQKATLALKQLTNS